MSKTVKVKSKTIEEFQCGCGKSIRYSFYKNYLAPRRGYQGYKTKPKLTSESMYYKISWLGALRLDNHHYKCEVQQNES